MELKRYDTIKLKDGRKGVLFLQHENKIELLMDLKDPETMTFTLEDIDEVYPWEPFDGFDDSMQPYNYRYFELYAKMRRKHGLYPNEKIVVPDFLALKKDDSK